MPVNLFTTELKACHLILFSSPFLCLQFIPCFYVVCFSRTNDMRMWQETMDVTVGVISFHRINQSPRRSTPSRNPAFWAVLPKPLSTLFCPYAGASELNQNSHASKAPCNVKLRYQKDGKALPQANQPRNHWGFPLYFQRLTCLLAQGMADHLDFCLKAAAQWF